jgi:hypothetical protein
LENKYTINCVQIAGARISRGTKVDFRDLIGKPCAWLDLSDFEQSDPPPLNPICGERRKHPTGGTAPIWLTEV